MDLKRPIESSDVEGDAKSTIASALGVLAKGFALTACGGDESTPPGAGDRSRASHRGVRRSS